MSRFIPIEQALKVAMLGNSDLQQRAKGRYLTWSKYVWEDLNLQSAKIAKREFIQINKRTNSLQMPCDFMQLCSVNVVCNGVIYPVFFNDNLKGSDMVEVAAAKDCACEYKCGYQLCNTIKGYEAIQSTKTDKNPDGSTVSFKCVDRISVQMDGFVIRETQVPTRVYMSGVWTETILQTITEKLCSVDLDEKGCLCDTEKNINNVCNACCGDTEFIPTGGTAKLPPLSDLKTDTWRYYCSSKMDLFQTQCGAFPRGFAEGCHNTYNISELGDRLIFPHHFGFDKVLVRYYTDVNLSNLQIPTIALDTFIAGIKWWDARFNDEKQQLAQVYEAQYAKLKFGLLLQLNKYRMAEMRMILTPKVYVPSFFSYRNRNNFGNGFGESINNA